MIFFNNHIYENCVGMPCFDRKEKGLCISPHNVMRCITQCSFQGLPCLICSICSLIRCSNSNFPFLFCLVVCCFTIRKCKLAMVAIVVLCFCGVIFPRHNAMGELGKNGCTFAIKLVGLGWNQGEDNPTNYGSATWWCICGSGREGNVITTFDVSKNSLIFAQFSITPTRQECNVVWLWHEKKVVWLWHEEKWREIISSRVFEEKHIKDQGNDLPPCKFALLVVWARKCMKFGTMPLH